MAEEITLQPDTAATPPSDATVPSAIPAAPQPTPAAPADEEAVEFEVSELLEIVPDTIRDYLLGDEIAAKREKIYADFSLNDEEQTIAMRTELEVFFGLMALGDFPDELWTRLPWPDDQEDKAKKLSIDILGRIFLPAQAWVGDVVGLLNELGADLKQFPQEQLEVREVSYVDGAKEIADSIDIGPLPDDMRKRLQHIIENRLRNIRDDLETKEALTKSKKTGGMELSDPQAQSVLDGITSRTRMTRYVEQVIPKTSGEAPSASSTRFTPDQIKKIYVGTPEEQKAVALRIEEILRDTGKDSGKLSDSLHAAIKPVDLSEPEQLNVIANVLAFAQEGGLLTALEEDERFREIVVDYMNGKGRVDDAAAFDDNPRDPKFVNLFLQFLLRGFAGLDEAESARFGLRVVNLFKRQGMTEYAGLVAFDLDEGKFKWLSPEQI